MAPTPEPQVPVAFDSDDDEEALFLLATVEQKCYTSFPYNCRDSEVFLTSSDDDNNNNNNNNENDHDNNGTIKAKDSGFPRAMRIWETYYGLLERRPLLVKSMTAFLLMGLADGLAQMVEHLRGLPYDAWIDGWRVARFGVFGLIGAPWTHYYYDWLDRTLPPTPKPWTMTTVVKVIIDQFLQAPALLALIIIGLAFMEGRGLDGIKDDMQRQYVYSLIENWKLWIPATIVNIAFMKPTLRVLYDNLVFVVWTIYLSMILNDKDRTG